MNRNFVMTTFAFVLVAGHVVPLNAALAAPADDQPSQGRLVSDWSHFAPADRAICLKMTGASGTYTGLLTCLREKRSARAAQ